MIVYEWDVEIVEKDGRGIVDHYFVNSLKEALDYVAREEASGSEYDHEIVLARDDERPDGRIDRLWAYLSAEKKLPESFSDAYETPRVKVPKKFHDECRKVA